MWSRGELKDRAKLVLRKIYLKALLIAIVISLAEGGDGWGNGSSFHFRSAEDFYVFRHWWLLSGGVLSILVLRILIGYSLEVGGRKYFVQSAQYKDSGKCFSFAFDGKNYIEIVKTMLVTNIFIFLWTLLLIIPGIIKCYAYRMVPYILADNPNIGVMRAIELSNEMTKGHKFDIFILDLSFLGWYFLGMLAFGIGIIFVFPYDYATNAELYLNLRKNYEGVILNNRII
ncbi:DUF975 family protein [Clostridium sp. SHJSY1]|uniref:DUF975 family protein n=1 Tax=Clostridium sp. SHJSY1 TaxID=2942483 RepID=UPI00287650BD|nr:DUF975 family protein [Clostridium sp. SHJSY1]MDS0528445.1 DUF975 family protein [Clostridium sp. SHJSY1]